MKRSKFKKLIRISALTLLIGFVSPIYCAASGMPASVLHPANPSPKDSKEGLKVGNEAAKTEAVSEKAAEKEVNTAPLKTADELAKELSNIKGRNDEMNDKVSKTNNQIIDTIKKIKSKKGLSRKQLRQFNKNEEAIGLKLESLTKLIEGLKENADKIVNADKKLGEIIKSEDLAKLTEVKSPDSKGAGESKPSDNNESVRVQLENLIWLQLDRNRLLLQIFDNLGEISSLLP